MGRYVIFIINHDESNWMQKNRHRHRGRHHPGRRRGCRLRLRRPRHRLHPGIALFPCNLSDQRTENPVSPDSLPALFGRLVQSTLPPRFFHGLEVSRLQVTLTTVTDSQPDPGVCLSYQMQGLFDRPPRHVSNDTAILVASPRPPLDTSPTMVHSAYDTQELLSTATPHQIQALTSHSSTTATTLLLGCSDGSLLVYGPPNDPPEPSPSEPSSAYSLRRVVPQFTKRPFLSLQVLHAQELLLSLSESITFHRLPGLETFAVLTKARGANAYCWDDCRGVLCFARQKKVCIFRHDGGRGFVEVKEFGIYDTVRSMAWCGANVCLGIRREYMIMNSSNGALSEVFPCGRLAPPLVVPLPSGELILGKDNIGVIVDQTGKLLPEGRICWSEAPLEVVIQKPYIVALLPRYVEIRSLRVPYPLIQTVVLRNARHIIESGSAIVVALDNSIYGLFPVPLGAQIVQLTASSNFEEALSLCKMLPPEEVNLRAAKEGSIHIRYAHYLFENGSYEEAMEHFLASQVDITYVLSLYPSLVLPKTNLIPDAEKLMEMCWDTAYLSRGSSGMSDDMETSSPSYPQEYEENAALESKKMSHNTLMALIKYLQKKRQGIIEKATIEGTEEVVSNAFVDGLHSYDSSRFKKSNKGRSNVPISSGARDMATILDTALLQALLLTGQSSAALELLKGLNYCDVKICEEVLQISNQYTTLLELYRSNGMHHEALKLLHELVHGKQTNKSGAEVIQKFNHESIIDYLKPLCGSDPMLVLDYAMSVLESCPDRTIELFLTGNIPADLVNSYLKQHAPNMQAKYLELMFATDENAISGNLQNEMVQIYLSEVLEWFSDVNAHQIWDEKLYTPTRKKLLSTLESITGYSPEALLKRLPTDALFEERAILLGKMNQHELALSLYVHKLHVPDLALSYCDRVYDSVVRQPSAKSPGSIYSTLLQIYLNPRKTTKNFEKRITNEISSQNANVPKANYGASFKPKVSRAVKKIAAIEGAEDMKHSPSGADSGKSDGDGDELMEEVSTIMLDAVLNVLSKRWDRINGAQAMRLLPRETKLQSLLPFLGPLVRKSSEANRNYSVIKSLRQSENLQVKDELYSERKTVVKITSDSMCSLCNKKIGTSVFAVYPNGNTLVHFVCFRDSQNMKTITRGSPLWKK